MIHCNIAAILPRRDLAKVLYKKDVFPTLAYSLFSNPSKKKKKVPPDVNFSPGLSISFILMAGKGRGRAERRMTVGRYAG